MKIYRDKKITDFFYMLGERISPHMLYAQGLVIGKKQIALVDTGVGMSDSILTRIRRISDLPVICLITHGDPDHAGAAALFDTIYMNPLEDGLMRASIPVNKRLKSIAHLSQQDKELLDYATAHMVPQEEFNYKNLSDGMMFDLGGQCLEAISLPGHTAGSICFYNRQEDYLLTGDAITRKPVLCANRCPPLSIYRDALVHLRQKITPRTTLYCGHSLSPLPTGIVDDLIDGCSEILSGKTQQDSIYQIFVPEAAPKNAVPMSHMCRNSVLQYNPNNL